MERFSDKHFHVLIHPSAVIADDVDRDQFHHYDKPYIFLRDVDVEPIVLDSEMMFDLLP